MGREQTAYTPQSGRIYGRSLYLNCIRMNGCLVEGTEDASDDRHLGINRGARSGITQQHAYGASTDALSLVCSSSALL